MKRLLIHGYAEGIAHFWRKKNPKLSGFSVFENEISEGHTKVFYWAKEVVVSPVTSLSPSFYVSHYLQERELARSDSVQKKLEKMLDTHKPREIFCHSLGCFLLTEYVKTHQLPPSVRSVVFLQSACSAKELKNSGLLSQNITLTNVYRVFDPTLWIGSLIHGSVRLGLHRFNHPKVNNVFFPSFRHVNVHVAVLHDERTKTVHR